MVARPPARSRAALAAVLATAVPALVACGDDTAAFCDRFADMADLQGLVDAVAANDGPTAHEELDRFRELAADAPEEIHDDMERITTVLAEVVELGTTGADASDTEIERRRTRANQQLADVTDSTTAVSAWAEEECGLRLS